MPRFIAFLFFIFNFSMLSAHGIGHGLGYRCGDSLSAIGHLKKMFPETAVRIGQQALAPFSWSAGQWLIAGAALGTSSASIAIDPWFDRQVKNINERHPAYERFSSVFTDMGDVYGVGAVAAFWTVGMLFGKPRAIETGVLVAEAVACTGLWIRAGKMLTGRERPSSAYISGVQGGIWYGPNPGWKAMFGDARYDAFPSGHTGTAFAIASVFAHQYQSDRPWVAWVAYPAAALVGFTRTTLHKHWISDVLLGAATGFFVGRHVVKQHMHDHHKQQFWSFSPVFGNGTFQLAGVCTW